MNDKTQNEMPVTPSRTNPCLNCTGRCCSRYLINLCTFDVWTIVRTLRIHPTDFVGFAELKNENPYSFIIDGSGRNYCMVVNKKELPDGKQQCIFALNLPDPIVRCGIYSCQPVACRSYPLALQSNKVIVAPCICSEGDWNTKSLNLTYWRSELQRHEMEFSIHTFLAAEWNAEMKSKPEMTRLDFRPFFEYLFKIYDNLEPIRSSISEKAWKGIYRRWRHCTCEGLNPLTHSTENDNTVPGWSLWVVNIRNAVKKVKTNHNS